VEGSCEHDNDPLGSTKFWEFLEQLSDLLVSQEELGSMEFFSYLVNMC
jgi:hypothetical protein